MLPVSLRTARLQLSVPAGDADIDAIVHYCQDPLFEQFLTTPWPYGRSDAVEFVDRLVPAWWAGEEEFAWAIRSVEGAGSGEGSHSGALLGVISWRTRGDVGYWMGAEHRGRGYMSEALAAVVDWVFAATDAPQIDWECRPGNVASARTARASGFRYTGIAPVIVPARDGTFPDSWHGMLRRDDDRGIKEGWPL